MHECLRSLRGEREFAQALFFERVREVLGLIWLVRRVVRFARKKATLEADRTMHVRQQVASAMKHVEEFQAAYATLPGDIKPMLETWPVQMIS